MYNKECYRVFISYSHEDSEELANRIYQSLADEGIRAFLDDIDIRRGEDGFQVMENALEECKYLVCIVTAGWVGSKIARMEFNSVLLDEDKRRKVIPLKMGVKIPCFLKCYAPINFVDWEEDYEICIEGLFRALSTETEFYNLQKERILNSSVLPWINGSNISFDYIRHGLFVDSDIVFQKHYHRATVNDWLECFRLDDNIIVVGEPGVGKSTILKQIAIYLMDRGTKIAYIEARELVNCVGDVSVDMIKKVIEKRYPYGIKCLNVSELEIILIDGLDEAKSDNIEKIFALLNQIKRKHTCTVMTCRAGFYHQYVMGKSMRNDFFDEIVSVQEWTEKQALDFVHEFSIQSNDLSIEARILEILNINHKMTNILCNPFRASLLIYLCSDAYNMRNIDYSNLYILYDEFYGQWFRNEEKGVKTGIKDDFLMELHKDIARVLYISGGTIDFSAYCENNKYDEDALLSDGRFSGLLKIDLINNVIIEKFQHETLMEFLVAKVIISAFEKGNDIQSIMDFTYSNDVNVFVRDGFKAIDQKKIEFIEKNMSESYMNLVGGEKSIPIQVNERIREQIIYYIGRLPLNYQPQILEFAYEKEAVPILKRSAALSLILGGNERVEMEYLQSVLNDEERNIENRSVQLVYFGDVDGDIHEYRDSGIAPWNRTKKVLLERLQMVSYRQKRLRLWDFITFSSFVESRKGVGVDLEDVKIIEECDIEFAEDSNMRKQMLFDEKCRLLDLIKKYLK